MDPQSDDEDPAAGSSSSGTTSEVQRTSARERALNARVKRRRTLLDFSAVHPTLANLSFLERAPIVDKTEKIYEEAVDRFLKWSDTNAGPLVADAEVDDAMVRYMNQQFSKGLPAHDGEQTLAGLMHFQ